MRERAGGREATLKAKAAKGTRAADARQAWRARERVGQVLLHIDSPARAADQAEPLPGTRWVETADGGGCDLLVADQAGGACDLVVTDPAAYGRFLWGSGRR